MAILGRIKPFNLLRFQKTDTEIIKEFEAKQKAKMLPRSMQLGEPELKGLAKEAKLQAEKFLKENSEFVPMTDWTEANMYNWKTVKEWKGQFDYSGAELLQLQPYQKRILDKILTPKENGKFPYTTVIWSQPKKHGKCGEENERIILANGKYKKLKELVNSNFEVLAFNEQTFEIVKTGATAIFNGSKPCIKIITKSGKTKTVTENHPLFTYQGWQEVQNLSIGDKVAFPLGYKTFSKPILTTIEIKLLAYLIGNGGMTTGAITFGQKNNKQLKEFTRLVNKFGCLLKKHISKNKWDGVSYYIAGKTRRKNKILDLIKAVNLYGKNSFTKFIPQEIFKATDKQAALFLNRLFSTDGNCYKKQINYCSASKVLIDEIIVLLQRLGIHAKQREKYNAKYQTTYYILEIESTKNILAFAKIVGIYGKEAALRKTVLLAKQKTNKRQSTEDCLDRKLWFNIEKECLKNNTTLIKQFGKSGVNFKTHAVTKEKLQQIYNVSNNKQFELLSSENICWDEIVKIERIENVPTIAVEVPKYHTYISNFIEHNTQIAACVGAWWSCIIESPNLILTLASNQEQSAGLIFKSARPSLFAKGGKVPFHSTSKPEIILPNGSTFQAIPNNYAGQAGGDYGLTLWSELWTYRLESDFRLYEELPPVPTRFNSIRWIETYAGFEDESKLLLKEYNRIFTDTKETNTHKKSKDGHKVEPVPGLEDITTRGRPSCWHIPEEGFFMFWDHEIRAPWIDDDYIRREKSNTRHSTFVRLWKNDWQSSEGTFISPEEYDACVTLEEAEWGPMVVAADASQRNDTISIVGVQKRSITLFGEKQDRFRVRYVNVYNPKLHKNSPEMIKLGAHKHDADLEDIISTVIYQMYEAGVLTMALYYDPFQLHTVAMNLRKKGVPCKEFQQGPLRLKADTHLWKLFNEKRIDLYPDEDMREHCLSAKTKEYENEQIRLMKGTASESKKIDACVALSMACYMASILKDIPDDNDGASKSHSYLT